VDTETPELLDEWMIVELLGHRRLAARVREVQIAGTGFLRLDVPDGATQYVAPSSVYALHPVSEQVCRGVAAHCRPDPVQRWELPAASSRLEPEDAAAETRAAADDYDTEGPF
jgi:hypothetical protein